MGLVGARRYIRNLQGSACGKIGIRMRGDVQDLRIVRKLAIHPEERIDQGVRLAECKRTANRREAHLQFQLFVCGQRCGLLKNGQRLLTVSLSSKVESCRRCGRCLRLRALRWSLSKSFRGEQRQYTENSNNRVTYSAHKKMGQAGVFACPMIQHRGVSSRTSAQTE